MEIRIDNDGHTNFHSFYNTSNPGLIVLLGDQTKSGINQMNDKNKNCSIAKEVNNFISNLIISNVYGDKIKDRCYLKLISFAEEKYEIKEGWLSFFADNPVKIEKQKFDTIKNEIENEEPMWIEDGLQNQSGPNRNYKLTTN